MIKMLSKILPLFFTSLAFVALAQTEVTFDTPIDITLEPSNCIGVDDCTGLQTEYAITDLDDEDAAGPRIVGVSTSSSFTLGEFVTEGNNFAVTPVCYNLESIQILVDAINTAPLCCTIINSVFPGACEIIQDAFPTGSDVENFADVLSLVEILGTSAPSLESFIESIDLINTNIGTVAIACTNAVAFDYCMNPNEQELFSVPTSNTQEALKIAGIDQLKIQPNPANTYFSISLENKKAGDAILELVDFTGKLVHQETWYLQHGTNLFAKDISGLSAGIYTVAIRKNGKLFTRKVIVE